MDKRIKASARHKAQMVDSFERRGQFYADIAAGKLSLGQAVVAMRKMGKLTQPEYAKLRGISVQSLRQIEAGTGNPTVETLNKVASLFGLEVGFITKKHFTDLQ